MGVTVLQTAIRAKLPMIAVRTSDPLNVAAMLEHYAEQEIRINPVIKQGVPMMPPESVTVIYQTDGLNLPATFTAAASGGAVLIIVNPEDVPPMAFDAGVVHMPERMLKDFVEQYGPEDVDKYELEAALRGLTFKEVVEFTKLAMAESGAFTAEAVLRVRRRRTVLSSGLKLVDTAQHFYAPPQPLTDWLAIDGRLFTANVERIVRPRGLLFSGDPGTGKTSGAKHLAHSLKLPLYLLDVGSAMQKYVGESEKTFQSALAQVETLAPCVLLLDEVEKAFDTTDESGVSRRVLGMLLWWLQEHQSQVLTVMTTNDSGSIPPELVRPGRIDREIEFRGLLENEALLFALSVAESLANIQQLEHDIVAMSVYRLCKASPNGRVTQAGLTQAVVDLVKVQMAANMRRSEE